MTMRDDGIPIIMIKILLADDHQMVREGLRRILEEQRDIQVVGEAATGEEAIRMADLLQPALVLMDLNMPGIGGIEATRYMLRHHPDIHVVVVTAFNDAPFPDRLREAGALGYIPKDCSSEELLLAVRTVAAGRPYLSPAVSEKLTLSRVSGGTSLSPFQRLSRREMEVLGLILQGMRNQDICDMLNLSPKTVSTHRQRLYEKLEVNTDVGLAFLALRYGLVEPLPEGLAEEA
jgi:two-component system, NarL family, invasion response regulator UvrY